MFIKEDLIPVGVRKEWTSMLREKEVEESSFSFLRVFVTLWRLTISDGL